MPGSPAFASRPARSADAAQSHHQGGDLRGPHAAPRRHRRPHRVPPTGRGGWRGDDHRRVLRGDAGREHRRTPADARPARHRPRAAAADGCDPRRRRGGGRPTRTFGPGRESRGHEVTRAWRRRACFSPLGMRRTRAVYRGGSRDHHATVRRRCPRPRRRRLRRDRDPPRSQLSAQRVPLAEAESPDRRMGRTARAPRAVPETGRRARFATPCPTASR